MSRISQERLDRLETAIGRVLRVGILVSSGCLAVGLAVNQTNPAIGGWLLRAGTLVLIATPASRVVVSLVDYILERDWLFAVLTLVVLIELSASVIAAIVFHTRL